MAERVCTCADNTANANRARELCGGRSYGRAFVEVVAADVATREVTFLMAGAGGNLVKMTCDWTRDNVWALCPSTLNCDEDKPPAPGSSGVLYLSKALIDGNQVAGTSKWPADLPGPDPEYRPLRIWPTSIQLRGVELATGTMTTGTIELMDPNIAAGQTLTLDGRPVTLELSQSGFFQFLAPWVSLDALQQAKATLSGKRGGASTAARDKARAWAQVAAWEAILATDGERRSEEHETASRLLAEIVAG